MLQIWMVVELWAYGRGDSTVKGDLAQVAARVDAVATDLQARDDQLRQALDVAVTRLDVALSVTTGAVGSMENRIAAVVPVERGIGGASVDAVRQASEALVTQGVPGLVREIQAVKTEVAGLHGHFSAQQCLVG